MLIMASLLAAVSLMAISWVSKLVSPARKVASLFSLRIAQPELSRRTARAFKENSHFEIPEAIILRSEFGSNI